MIRNAGSAGRAPSLINPHNRRRFRWARPALLAALTLLLPAAAWGADPPPASAVASVVDQTQAKVVKIYGVGGIRGLEAYQSGFLISAEGHIVTAMSHVLDTERITAVLSDGRKFEAKLLGADPRVEVAVLKINTTDLPCFDVAEAPVVAAGTRVMALSNLFNVAMGDEASSVQHGTVAVVTHLEARRGVFETPYRGPVYVLDVTTNNPGAAGGALVTRQGKLVAMLGKELRNSLNNTWLNYAIPIDQLRESIDAIRAGKFVKGEKPVEKKPARSAQVGLLGIVLVPDVLDRTPAFVDEVRPGSSAARAGLKPDDLILLVGTHLVQSCRGLQTELDAIDRGDPVKLTVLRGADLVDVTLQPADEDK
jgi:S1-C subfamily serine protease